VSGSRRIGPICQAFAAVTDRTTATSLCEEIEFGRILTHAVEEREMYGEGGSRTRMALDGNLSSMLFDDPITDG